MKLISLMLYSLALYADSADPFKSRTSPIKKTSMMIKYQYLGYIKGPNLAWGFIRPVGGDILKVVLGKSMGLGKVISFNRDSLCINHAKKTYCLKRSSQALNWHTVS